MSLYTGSFAQETMWHIVFDPKVNPYYWRMDFQDGFVGASASRPLIDIGDFAEIVPEVGVGQRFGYQHEQEFWGALYLRFYKFPWSPWLRTTIAINTGLNYATGVSTREQFRSADGVGARWMHYLGPEITLGLPQYPDVDLLFRLHHRSGAFGLVNNAGGGVQYGSVGLRIRF